MGVWAILQSKFTTEFNSFLMNLEEQKLEINDLPMTMKIIKQHICFYFPETIGIRSHAGREHNGR